MIPTIIETVRADIVTHRHAYLAYMIGFGIGFYAATVTGYRGKHVR